MKALALVALALMFIPSVAAESCAVDSADAGGCYIGYVGTPVYELCVVKDRPPGCAGEWVDRIMDLVEP